MSNHQKRLSAPTTWPVERKTETFTVKASPGPHGETGVPLLIILRDVLEYVDSRKEARYALDRGQVRINGDPVRNERRAVGIFDVLTFDERGDHYRVFPGQGGRLALTPLDADDAASRLGKVTGKRQVAGGRTQLTLHDGATIHIDRDVRVGDSLILDVNTDEIVARFPYEEGALVTAVDGRHSGEIGTLAEVTVTPGSNPNSVQVATDDGAFETIEDYLVVIDEAFVSDDADDEPVDATEVEPEGSDEATEPVDGDTDPETADDEDAGADDEEEEATVEPSEPTDEEPESDDEAEAADESPDTADAESVEAAAADAVAGLDADDGGDDA